MFHSGNFIRSTPRFILRDYRSRKKCRNSSLAQLIQVIFVGKPMYGVSRRITDIVKRLCILKAGFVVVTIKNQTKSAWSIRSHVIGRIKSSLSCQNISPRLIEVYSRYITSMIIKKKSLPMILMKATTFQTKTEKNYKRRWKCSGHTARFKPSRQC